MCSSVPIRSVSWILALLLLLLSCYPPNAAGLPEVRCQGFQMRNDPVRNLPIRQNFFKENKNCTVIEGDMHLLLSSSGGRNLSHVDYQYYQLPNVREIIGSLFVFQVEGLKTLGDILPNLRIIRGHTLIHNYALVVYDNMHLENLGLVNLQEISRGGVRITNNMKLCYVDTIDWRAIMHEGGAHIVLEKNSDDDNCHSDCQQVDKSDLSLFSLIGSVVSPSDANICHQRSPDSLSDYYCWDDQHCQKICPKTCLLRNLTCNLRNPEDCCHESCVGGCVGSTAYDCIACKLLIHEGRCVEKCPDGYYEFQHRRCLTLKECKNTTPEVDEFERHHYFKPINKCCTPECPKGYEESETDQHACIKCSGECKKRCHGLRITSLQESQQLRGCDIIVGRLAIQLRGDVAGSVVEELASALGQITEVTEYVLVSFSPSFVNLNFLRSLEIIHGEQLWGSQYALTIFDNQHLADLWSINNTTTGTSKLVLKRGKVQIQNNPLLCYQKVEQFIEFLGLINETDVQDASPYSNGNKAICEEVDIPLSLEASPDPDTAVFNWKNFETSNMDNRYFMGYQLFYKAVSDKENVSIMENRDACHDTWSMVVFPKSARGGILMPLKPNTLYAAYIRTLMILAQSPGLKSGISKIVYFRTPFNSPSSARLKSAGVLSDHSIYISWLPPIEPNGEITHYMITWAPLQLKGSTVDYCNAQNASHVTNRKEKPEEDAPPDHCKAFDPKCCRACNEEGTSEEPIKGKMINATFEHSITGRPEDFDRVQERIQFENYIHNIVFEKSSHDDNESKRKKREVLHKDEMNAGVKDSNAKTTTASYPHGNEFPVDGTRRRSGSYHTTEPSSDLAKPSSIQQMKPTAETIRPLLEYDNGSETPSNDTGFIRGAVPPTPTPVYHNIGAGTKTAMTINVTSLNYTITNLTHMTEYEIKIWACQNRSVPKHHCSTHEALIVKRTHSLPTKDEIPYATFRRINVTNSQHRGMDYQIEWRRPKSPNGRVRKYHIRINYQQSAKGNLQSRKRAPIHCIPTNGTLTPITFRYNHTFRSPGNYSVELAAITDNGLGPWKRVCSLTTCHILIASDADNNKIIYIIAAVIGIVFSITVAVCAAWIIHRRPHVPEGGYIGWNPLYYTNYKADKWELERLFIKLGHEIGTGTFGKVLYAEAEDKDHKMIKSVCGAFFGPCAVKMLRENVTDIEQQLFLREAQVWKNYRSAHIVQLYGVISDGRPALIVMEFMQRGNLRDYLRARRPDVANETGESLSLPSLAECLKTAAEIADGMAYLESKEFAHRDLAARNVMVAMDGTCKIGDFGMARMVQENEYYQPDGKRLIPVRWMSPQALNDAKFNSMSDVWAYGVVLWEIATLGQQPYYGIADNQDVITYVIAGSTMDIPTDCPEIFSNLMKLCWRYQSRDRPHFYIIVDMLMEEMDEVSREKFRETAFHCNRDQIEPDQENDQETSSDDKKLSSPVSVDSKPPDYPTSLSKPSLLSTISSPQKRNKCRDRGARHPNTSSIPPSSTAVNRSPSDSLKDDCGCGNPLSNCVDSSVHNLPACELNNLTYCASSLVPSSHNSVPSPPYYDSNEPCSVDPPVSEGNDDIFLRTFDKGGQNCLLLDDPINTSSSLTNNSSQQSRLQNTTTAPIANYADIGISSPFVSFDNKAQRLCKIAAEGHVILPTMASDSGAESDTNADSDTPLNPSYLPNFRPPSSPKNIPDPDCEIHPPICNKNRRFSSNLPKSNSVPSQAHRWNEEGDDKPVNNGAAPIANYTIPNSMAAPV